MGSTVTRVTVFVEWLGVLQKHVDRFGPRVADVFAAHGAAAFVCSLPGAGSTLVPRILVAFGDDLDRYREAGELQMASGIAPVQRKTVISARSIGGGTPRCSGGKTLSRGPARLSF